MANGIEEVRLDWLGTLFPKSLSQLGLVLIQGVAVGLSSLNLDDEVTADRTHLDRSPDANALCQSLDQPAAECVAGPGWVDRVGPE